jgi:cytidine deaminase
MVVSQPPIDRRTALARMGSSTLTLLGLASAVLPGRVAYDDSQRSLPTLTNRARQVLQPLLDSPNFRGQIPGNKVRELVNSEGKDVSSLMLALLPLARRYSRPPISNYHVGAVARGASGSLYLGMNVEIPGHSLGFSVHGEQAALSNAYMHAESGVGAIAVTAAPCGHCRQFMNEMSPNGEIEVLVKGKPALKLSSLLPMAFGPNDLGFKNGAFPARKNGPVAPSAADDELQHSALEAARYSYAPYSQAYSGVAIGTQGDRVYGGSYIENAAFNPSLSPLQSALVQLIVAGEDYSAITRVVLAEIKDAKISQVSVTRAVLSTVAPAAELRTIYVNRG